MHDRQEAGSYIGKRDAGDIKPTGVCPEQGSRRDLLGGIQRLDTGSRGTE